MTDDRELEAIFIDVGNTMRVVVKDEAFQARQMLQTGVGDVVGTTADSLDGRDLGEYSQRPIRDVRVRNVNRFQVRQADQQLHIVVGEGVLGDHLHLGDEERVIWDVGQVDQARAS